MELSPEEKARMWCENCGKLNLELQAEQQKRIWFENRYNEIVRALQTLQAAQQGVQADLQPCGHPKKNLVTDEKGATYCFSCAVASR